MRWGEQAQCVCVCLCARVCERVCEHVHVCVSVCRYAGGCWGSGPCAESHASRQRCCSGPKPCPGPRSLPGHWGPPHLSGLCPCWALPGGAGHKHLLEPALLDFPVGLTLPVAFSPGVAVPQHPRSPCSPAQPPGEARTECGAELSLRCWGGGGRDVPSPGNPQVQLWQVFMAFTVPPWASLGFVVWDTFLIKPGNEQGPGCSCCPQAQSWQRVPGQLLHHRQLPAGRTSVAAPCSCPWARVASEPRGVLPGLRCGGLGPAGLSWEIKKAFGWDWQRHQEPCWSPGAAGGMQGFRSQGQSRAAGGSGPPWPRSPGPGGPLAANPGPGGAAAGSRPGSGQAPAPTSAGPHQSPPARCAQSWSWQPQGSGVTPRGTSSG